MKLRSSLYILACTLGGLLTLPAVHAEDYIEKLNVPFEFSVGDKAMPAGDYVVQRDAGRHILIIRSTDHKAAAAHVGHGITARTPSDVTKVVFNRYGEKYFLSSVWVQGDANGTAIKPSKAEREYVAKVEPGASVALIARR